MYEVHGLARLSKRAVMSENSRTVSVEDGGAEVILRIAGETYSTGMTPDEAEWLSQQLTAAAKRVRNHTVKESAK